MNSIDPLPQLGPPPDPGGGMTGATGNLSPDDPEGDFVPAERREVDAPEGAGQVTAAAHLRHQLRRGAERDDPGHLVGRGVAMPPNDRDGGYGSEHGLAPDDPAYRMEEHPPTPAPPSVVPRSAGKPRLGGDELQTAEKGRY